MKFGIRNFLIVVAIICVVISLLLPFSGVKVEAVEFTLFPDISYDGEFKFATRYENTGLSTVWYYEESVSGDLSGNLTDPDNSYLSNLPRAVGAKQIKKSGKVWFSDHKDAEWRCLLPGQQVLVFQQFDLAKESPGIQLRDRFGWQKEVFCAPDTKESQRVFVKGDWVISAGGDGKGVKDR